MARRKRLEITPMISWVAPFARQHGTHNTRVVEIVTT